MKLYAVVGSNNSRKVLAVINHLGLDVELNYLDFFTGDLRKPDFVALNPSAKVPVLVDGDLVLPESNAINMYLCDTVPETGLYPKDIKTRARIHRWLSWELAHYNRALGFLAWETVAKPNFLKQETDNHIATWAAGLLETHAAVLDRHMEARDYVVGDGITIADYALIHIEFFKDIMPFDWSRYPALNAYYDRMRAVPYWAATAVAPEAIGRKPKAA